MAFVAAADETYGRCLHQFLLSAERLGLDARHPFVVGDLGLAPARRTGLERRFPWCRFERFPFEDYPPHVAVKVMNYAWKPLLLGQVAARFPRLLYLDSATLLRRSPAEVEAWLDRQGVYSLAGQCPLRERCDPRTAAAFGASPELLARREQVATLVGFDTRHPVAARVLARWGELALRPEIILARHPGHIVDQALLSLLLLDAAQRGELVLEAGDVDISSGTPVTWMSTRNKVPAWLPAWTDPAVRAWYAVTKAADQWNHRRLNAASGR